MYNLRFIRKIMRCFSSIGNINRVNLYMANIEVHFHLLLISHLGQSNTLKSVLYIEKLVISQQIIFSKSVITRKKNLMTITPSIRPSQVMNKYYNTGLPSIKVLKKIKIQLSTLKICQYLNLRYFVPNLSNFIS